MNVMPISGKWEHLHPVTLSIVFKTTDTGVKSSVAFRGNQQSQRIYCRYNFVHK